MAASGLVLVPVEVEAFPRSARTDVFYGSSGSCAEAIQIFLVTLGADSTVTPMNVSDTDTISSVKMRIQACKGVYADQQRLVYCGRELRGDTRSLVKDWGVGSGEVVHLVVRLSDLVDVRVKTVSGKEYLFKVRRNQRVRYLKQRISEKEGGLSADEQHLMFKGRRLEDHTQIPDVPSEDVVIHLVVKNSVKVRSRSLGKDIELSVTAAELDALIDNFSSTNIEESTLAVGAQQGHVNPVGPCSAEVLEEPSQHAANNLRDILPDQFLLESEGLTDVPDSLINVIRQARKGVQAGYAPVLSSVGSSGAYFFRNGTPRNVAIFKPVDEEPEAVNNPRKSPGNSDGSSTNSSEGLKSGILVGEGAMREVAAYLLDHPREGCRTSATRDAKGFADVPPTMMVRSAHAAYSYCDGDVKAKVGSLQQFVEAVSNCEDMGPASFLTDDVHKIAVLDLRLANTDRSGGNILVCKSEESSAYRLVPIDHGYCLPDKFEDCTFEWLYWSQAKKPFTEDTLMYIASLDAEKDLHILATHGIGLRPECVRTLRVATMLLKKGAAAGFTPFEIGSMMTRERWDVKSPIEAMLEITEACTSPEADEDGFLRRLSEIMDRYLGRNMNNV